VSANGSMNPRKVIMAIIITGVIIVASVGCLFVTASYVGLINAEVYVSGSVQGSNATHCSLYVDGAKVATNNLGGSYYGSYGNYFSFYDIEVKANMEHEFKVITSEGEESDAVTEYTPFGERTSVSLNIVRKEVSVHIRGNYQGTNSSLVVYCYADNQWAGMEQVNYPSQTDYYFTAVVYEKSTHTFRLDVQSPYYGSIATNQTTVYVGSTSMTIYMDVG